MPWRKRWWGLAAAIGMPVVCLHATTVDSARRIGERVEIVHERWRLVGDFVRPATAPPRGSPAVLLLNGAGRDRTAYRDLADRLAGFGIASLRIDLRGMGESTNLGRFIPFDSTGNNEAIGFGRSWTDVVAALRWLARSPGIDAERLGAVGASYSAEMLAIALRAGGLDRGPIAVAALSPGSFSDSSLALIDGDSRAWLFAYSTREITVRRWQMDQWTRRGSRRARVIVVRDQAHATDLLKSPGIEPRLAEWFTRALAVEPADDRWGRAADRVAEGIGPGWDDLRKPGDATPWLGDGSGGRVRFLTAWHLARGADESRAALRRAVEQLAATPVPESAGNSLYSGRPGVAIAWLDAADALGDSALRVRARAEVARIRAAADTAGGAVRWGGADDVLTGNAGTVAALFGFWRRLDDSAARLLAFAGARTLARRGIADDGGRWWHWRDGAPWNLPNFSHGTAGIATVLATISRDPGAPSELLDAALAGGAYLSSIATRDSLGMRVPYGWPIPEGGWARPFDVGWAHGQAGTARLFVELWRATHDPAHLATVEALVAGLDSARLLDGPAPAYGTEPFELDYRFGLTGIADLFADLYDLTGRRAYLTRAVALAERIAAAADTGTALRWTRPRRPFMEDPGIPATFTGFLHGAAGPGMLFLKLDALLRGRRPPSALPDSPFGGC
ncbi:MAG: lanthionine synthetase LanC family protein [Gemmatimonadales bacterium]